MGESLKRSGPFWAFLTEAAGLIYDAAVNSETL